MIPTFLYIKQHSVTGLLYFGKTTKDPEKYLGFGKFWTSHIRKHGTNNVKTLWYCLYYSQDELSKFSLLFSVLHNIVSSNSWANLSLEKGTDGGYRYNNHFKLLNKIPKTAEQRAARSGRQLGKSYKQYPVTINDITYPSITAAGRHFNITDAAIHYWIKIGKASRSPYLFTSNRFSCIHCRKELSIKSTHQCR